MDEYKDKRYIKEIIKEYNILLESWGSSESWDLNQFKTLENMIFETTKIDVNANTLKRFFNRRQAIHSWRPKMLCAVFRLFGIYRLCNEENEERRKCSDG